MKKQRLNTNIFEFENVDECILCGSEEQLDARGSSWHGVGFSYCICKGCGLKYMRPRPTADSYQRFYQDDYWQQNMAGAGYASNLDYGDEEADQLKLRMPKYERVYQHVRDNLRDIDHLRPESTILEVGCAFGFTLEWLKRDFGCQTFGVEPSSEAAARCEQGRVPIVASTGEALADMPVDRQYDVILYRHALDPITDPVRVLKGTRRHLKDDGVLLIHCVNVEFYDAMDPYHPFLYSPQTLRRLLAKVGFQVFRHDHSLRPQDRRTAVSIVSPSYQQIAFAKKIEPTELPAGQIDALAEARVHELGAAVMSWHQLGFKDMLKQLASRSLKKSVRTVERAYQRARTR